MTGKRSRRQAKTKLQESVEQDPDMRQALMADVESEEDEALVETESESDGSADRPGGNSDGEGDHTCSCEGCDMPSETWVGDEPRCAQCTGERTQSRNLPTTFFSFWACAALAKAFVGNEFEQSPPGCGLGWGGASPSTDS